MSRYQFEIKDGILYLEENSLPSYFPLLQELPFEFKKLVNGYPSPPAYVEEFYKQLNQHPGSERHKAGILYMNDFLSNQEKTGLLGCECIIKAGKKIFRPDITVVNGRIEFIEVQSSGFINKKKSRGMKSLKSSVNCCLSVAIPYEKRYVKRLRNSFKKRKLEDIVSKVYLYPTTLEELFYRPEIKIFHTQKFLELKPSEI